MLRKKKKKFFIACFIQLLFILAVELLNQQKNWFLSGKKGNDLCLKRLEWAL